MIEKRAADYLAERLYEAGCRHAFGMPGGEVLTLVNALEKAGILCVLARHENAAAFMAEGVWHRTGAPGILIATLGPGLMNGINAITNAIGTENLAMPATPAAVWAAIQSTKSSMAAE